MAGRIIADADGEALRIDGNNTQISFYQSGAFKSFINHTASGLYMGVNNGNIRFDVSGGQVAIGSIIPAASGYKLTVTGKVICEELKVKLSGSWPDYVFNNNYNLMPLAQLQNFIGQNKHLPNIPSAAEVEKEGITVGDMQKRLMEKVEELTLYILDLQKQIDQLKASKKKQGLMKTFMRHTRGLLTGLALLQTPALWAQPKPEKAQHCGVTDENSRPYFARIRSNVQALAAKNPPRTESTAVRAMATPTVKFSWPLLDTKGSNFTYYGINNYVDLEKDPVLRDPFGNYISGLQDYNCGTRAYDGHNGLDIDLQPYSWKMVDDETVWVVAAADGIIVDGDDGNFDENCDWDNITGPNWGNFIVLMHEDSTISVYVHMKEASVIPVTIGQRISRGQYLGVVASSGRSTGPHLHFGVYINNVFNSDGSLFDRGDLKEPFYGSCNTSLPSFWQSQKPYNEPSVIAIETHNAQPGVYSSNCDRTVSLYYDKSFSAGSTVYTRTWFRDWIDGSTVFISLISPSGGALSTRMRTNGNNSRRDRADENFSLASFSPPGTYTVRVLFDGKVWERYFTVGCVQDYTVSGTLTGPKGYVAGNRISTTQVIETGSDNRVEYHPMARLCLT